MFSDHSGINPGMKNWKITVNFKNIWELYKTHINNTWILKTSNKILKHYKLNKNTT